MKAFNIQGISPCTYHKHQRNLLLPTINWQRKNNQTDLIQDTTDNGDVVLGGDVRADTPGK